MRDLASLKKFASEHFPGGLAWRLIIVQGDSIKDEDMAQFSRSVLDAFDHDMHKRPVVQAGQTNLR